MPQYRKLSTRTPESFDFNDLPDDFTRLTWLQLPLVSCSDGRGIDIPGWLIGRIYPLRQDVTPAMIDAAMSAFEAHGMVTRYSIDGRSYYQIVNWTKYQGNTDKESDSPYPTPELVQSSAGVAPELVESKSALDADADADADANTDAEGDAERGASAPAHPLATSPRFQPVPKATRRGKRVDELLDLSPLPAVIANAPPAMTLIHEVTGHWPGENNRQFLVENLGEQPDKPALQKAFQLWSAKGYRATDYIGICEWYQEILRDPAWTPAARYKNGKNKPTPSTAPPVKLKEIAPGLY